MSANAPQDSALQAAHVELFVLRASVSASQVLKGSSVAFAPAGVPVSTSRAAEILAATPKPLRCNANAGAGGVLFVECVQLSGQEESTFHADYVRVMEEQLASARGPAGSTGFGDTVLLRSAGRPGEDLAVPELTFVRWYREYQLPPSITFGVWSAAPNQRVQATHPILEVHRVDPVDPESLPPELRFPSR